MDVAVDAAAASLSGSSDSPSAAPAPAAPAASTPTPQGSSVTPGAPTTAAPGAPGAASSPAPKAAAPAAAIAPIGDDDVPELANPKGQIPVARVKEILANSRTREGERVRTELQEVYGVDPKTYKELEIGAHVQSFLKNPVEYWQELGRTLQAAGVKLQFAGASPAAGAPPAAAPAAPPARPAAPATMPEPDFQTPDGTPVYSAQRLAEVVQFHLAEFEKRLDPRLKPIEGLITQQRDAEIQREATDWAKNTLKEAQTWEGWKEVQADVRALMVRDARYTIDGAYNKVFREKFLPGLKARHRQETLDELNAAKPASTPAPSTAHVPGTRQKKGGVDWDAAINSALDKAAGSAS